MSFDLAATPIEPGLTLIEASAGTGKTYTLAALVVRLIAEGHVAGIAQVLVVTFTNAATGELAGRIRDALRNARRQLAGEIPLADAWLRPLEGREDAAERLRMALLEIDQATIATLHGFCKQVLDRHAFESGLPFDVELLEDDLPLVAQVAEDLWRRHLYPPGDDAALLAALAIWRNWAPQVFLGHWRELHRHPGTRLAPAPLPLGEALAALRAGLATLAATFDRAQIQLALGRLPFRDRAAHSAGALAALADEADACLRRGEVAALPALQRLRRSELVKSLQRGREQAADHAFFTACDDFFPHVERLEHAFRAVLFAQLDRALAEVKEAAGLLSFDDLLRRLEAALRHPRLGRRLEDAVRRRFQAVLIDEFQDTDLVQWRIFQRLFGGERPFFLIGDPKQAIYRFRGADIFAYLHAREQARRRYDLPLNWRSPAALVAAVQAIFGAPAPFVFADIALPAVAAAPATASRRLEAAGDPDKPLELWWLDQQGPSDTVKEAVAGQLAAGIVELLAGSARLVEGDASRPLHAGDLAVLVRTNEEAQLVQEALRRWAVPSVIARAGDIFHSDEMAELARLVAALADVRGPQPLRALAATLLWGGDAALLHRLAEDDRDFQSMADRLARYRETWRRQGFAAACEQALAECRVRERWLAWVDGERRLTNLQHAIEVTHQAIAARGLSAEATLAWLELERRRARHPQESSELRLESDARAVHLVTIHTSKGLEYEVVFCPFLWRTRRAEKPVSAQVGEAGRVLDFGVPGTPAEEVAYRTHRALADAERLAEDLRLLYVALTRARQRCVVFWGRLASPARQAATALAWLLHRGQQALESWDLDRAREAAAAIEAAGGEIAARADRWRTDVEALCRRAPIALRELPAEPPAPSRRWSAGERRPALAALPLANFRPRLESWRVTSFSSLSRGEGRADTTPDHADFADPSWPRPAAAPAQGIFAFARGARAGSCLHEIFELSTFGALDTAETRARIDHTLARWGLERADAHPAEPGYQPAEAVLAMLRQVLRARLPPLGGEAFALEELAPAEMLAEWAFHLPLDPLAPSRLALLLRGFAGELPAGYSERVAQLGDQPVRGFLKGFVDLLFRHQGRFYCLDWKSNHLGDHAADYGPATLELAMVEHHYVLQALIYTVAIHRFLGVTVPGYDYDEHWGGAYYVFVRGVDTAPPRDLFDQPAAISGVYGLRPSRALIEKLDRAITHDAGQPDEGGPSPPYPPLPADEERGEIPRTRALPSGSPSPRKIEEGEA